MRLKAQLLKMQKDWDQRAQENARHFIATGRTEWTDEAFFQSGEQTLREQIANDLGNVCQGKLPAQMRVLEIGCGEGRITRALANFFGEVHAVDISGDMVARARRSLAECPNVSVYRNNGMDLRGLPNIPFDFAFSMYVFQHIASYEVIESYLKEVHRLLRPGALFKFQCQGHPAVQATAGDTWLGVSISEQRASELAGKTGFDFRYSTGSGTEEFWLWFFRGDDHAAKHAHTAGEGDLTR